SVSSSSSLPLSILSTSSFITSCLSFFFFYCYRHPRVLPSFPTRRSSDLEAACDLAVLELGDPGATDRIGELVRRGIPVLAYGSHVKVELLRAAREAGATAVPNSQVEAQLRDLLTK